MYIDVNVDILSLIFELCLLHLPFTLPLLISAPVSVLLQRQIHSSKSKIVQFKGQGWYVESSDRKQAGNRWYNKGYMKE